MKLLSRDVIEYIKSSPGVIYSLLLVLIVPTIVYFGIYFSLLQFEERFNQLKQNKAYLMENVFAAMTEEASISNETLQSVIEKIVSENSSVSKIQVVGQRGDETGRFEVVASSDQTEIGLDVEDDKHGLLLSDPAAMFANLDTENDERYWEVARRLSAVDTDYPARFLKARLSMRDVDEAFLESMKRAYLIVVVTAMVMILLVSNYIRLTQYIIKFHHIKEIDKMKDDFVSMASHELKTPLVAISGYADLIASEKASLLDDETKEYISNIRVSSDRLKDLVNDILEVSRLEQDRIPFNFEKIDINELAKKVVGNLAPTAKEKKLELNLNSFPEPTWVSVDIGRLEQILVNLVGNAIKYTPTGSVTVMTTRVHDTVSIAIQDTGLGMNAQQQKHLFEKFYRIKDEKRSKIPGTGLGLWITKQLIEKMKGEIAVESMEGVGSKFIVSFPAQK